MMRSGWSGFFRTAVCVGLLLAVPALSASAAPDTEPLKRRGFLGTALNPVSDETRDRQKLASSDGAEVTKVFPGSTAADAGLKVGDVIVAVDGAEIKDPAQFVQKVTGRKARTRFKFTYYRDGTKTDLDLTLKALPLESKADRNTVYGAVTSKEGRLRTIVTKPLGKAQGKRPALFLIQGIGAFSIESSPGGIEGYAAIIDDFNSRGFVTMRVDKPGCGDSEGRPLRDVDFDTQLDGFRQALRALKADPDVDPNKILIFGHSMGGAWGPLLAEADPVRGIAVYGTLVKTWEEYTLANSRRQLRLAGHLDGDIDQALRNEAAVNHYVYRDGLTPEQVVKKYPELEPWVEQAFQDGKYYAGCHYLFFRQLAEKNLAAAWEKFPGNVLAVWGKADFVSAEDDHALIADIANRNHPGKGQFIALDGIDHGFHTAAAPEESFANSAKPGVPFNDAIVKMLREWSTKVVGESS